MWVHTKLLTSLEITVHSKVYALACIVGVLESLILALNSLSIWREWLCNWEYY